MQVQPPAMTNPTPKQDGQSIERILIQLVRECQYDVAPSNFKSDREVESSEKALESYCAERERLARIDELEKTWVNEFGDVVVSGSGFGYKTKESRLAELQQQSSSQEEND